MPRLRAAALIACLAVAGPATAQMAAGRQTGDVWVDARLADIDAYAAVYRDAFVDEMVRYHRAPRELVREVLARPGWTPGDLYYACGLALQAGRPCRAVVDLRSASPAPGWESVARDLGAVPGSTAFHAFKRGIVATYDRWARPLRVDAELAPEFPGKPREAARPPDSP